MVNRFEFSQFAGVETVEDGDYVLHSDFAAMLASHARLLEALTDALPYIATSTIAHCHGNKCSEPWCIGCSGEEIAERAAERGMTAYRKGHEIRAIAAAKTFHEEKDND